MTTICFTETDETIIGLRHIIAGFIVAPNKTENSIKDI